MIVIMEFFRIISIEVLNLNSHNGITSIKQEGGKEDV
jgi:hypothetical protein